MACRILIQHAIVTASIELAHACHGNLERVAALSRSRIHKLGNRNLTANIIPGSAIVLAHQHVFVKP